MEAQRSPDSRKQEGVVASASWTRWPRRVVVYTTGAVIVVAGIVILPLPGPMGTPIILIGLTVLARESPRAEHIRARMVEALRLKQLAEARPKRLRLHFSTVAALTVTAGVLVGANLLPMERTLETDSPWLAFETERKRKVMVCETQGWPWPYRVGDRPDRSEDKSEADLLPVPTNPGARPNAPVTKLVLASFSSQELHESLNRWLALDALIALAIMAAVGAPLEWLARRRGAQV
ncbi:MAG: hypothetical protein AMXMBFR7_45330 [Planctomycetota bacterium]